MSGKRLGQQVMGFMRRKRRKKPGRKPKGARAGVSHAARPKLDDRLPVHVTWRVRADVWNLRTRKSFRMALRAFQAAAERFGMRLTHFSVQGNHVHMLVEPQNEKALSRGMQGLGIRLAKGINRLMGRSGAVFGDRYHAHVCRTPREALRAIEYVLGNTLVHQRRVGLAGDGMPDLFAAGPNVDVGWRWFLGDDRPPVAEPKTWLLRGGWRRALAA